MLAKTVGKTAITVITADGGKTATCEVEVLTAVTGVTLNETSLELTVGDEVKLVATVEPENADNKGVKWYSTNEGVATVDQEGNVKVVKEGHATIKVTTDDGDKTASCQIEASPAPVAVTGVTLDVSSVSLTEEGSQKLEVTVEPADASNTAVTFTSSDESVATVDDEGNITAVGVGTAIITVTTADGGFTASCEVTITAEPVAVNGVSLEPSTITLKSGESYKLVPKFDPENATNKAVSWRSTDSGVAAVDEEGNVTAKNKGQATILVTTQDGGKTANCQVIVIVPVTGVTISADNISVEAGQSQQLSASVQPSNASDKGVTWSTSDSSVATVDGSGKVTGVKEGSATITVTTKDGGKTASCQVTVTKTMGHITKLEFEKTSLTLTKDDVYDLNYTLEYTEPMAPFAIGAESSDYSIATAQVKFSGSRSYVEIEAISPGTCTISLSVMGSDFPPATCEVTVTQGFVFIPVESFEFTSGSNLTLDIGETGTAHLKMIPADASFANFTVYVSDFSVIDVSRKDVGPGEYDYVIKGLKPGTATLTISIPEQGNISATATVTVKEPVHVTRVWLDKSSYSVPEGQTQVVGVSISPTNAANPNIMVGSSDWSVVTIESVDYIGAGRHRLVIKGLKPGTATITVITEDGELTASAPVTVTEHVAITGITVYAGENLSISETETATISLRPTPSNASNIAITTSVSDPTVLEVTSVSYQSQRMYVYVKGLKEGTATVTATTEEGGYTATANVTVTKYVPVTAFSFDRSSLTTTDEGGKYEDILYVFEPTNATYPPTRINVTCSDREVAIAYEIQKGTVRIFPLKPGTCTITATITDSDIPPATCVVTVLPH